MANGAFHAQVSAWVAETKARREAVVKEARQRVVAVMQQPVGAGGNMPVDTGFLRASLVATTGAVPVADRANPGGMATVNYNEGQIALVIAGAKITDTLTVAYTANYARFANYGANGRPGRQFVGLAAQRWAQIVDQVCHEAQERVQMTMRSPADVATALFAHLDTFATTAGLPVSWPEPKETFVPPADGKYLVAAFFPNSAAWQGVSDGAVSQGLLLVTVVWPRGQGVIAPNAMAAQVATHFAKTTKLRQGAATVKVSGEPWAAPPLSEPDKVSVPVTVPWVA